MESKWSFAKDKFLFFIPSKIAMYIISALTLFTIKIPHSFNLTGAVLTLFDICIVGISCFGAYATYKNHTKFIRYFDVLRWVIVIILTGYYCYLILFYFFFLDDLVEKCEDIYGSIAERNIFCNRSNIKHSIVLEIIGMVSELLVQAYFSYHAHKYSVEMQTYDIEYENLESQRYKNKHRILPIETNYY